MGLYDEMKIAQLLLSRVHCLASVSAPDGFSNNHSVSLLFSFSIHCGQGMGLCQKVIGATLFQMDYQTQYEQTSRWKVVDILSR